jgi:hypothetical protein
MARSSFLTNCPRCGYIAEAWTEDGVTAKIHYKMCGYEDSAFFRRIIRMWT